MIYVKSQKYTDYQKIYDNCSGPGGLRLAEFIAEKMSIEEGKKLLDIGFFRGYQTCFLAKEYNVDIVAIDPGTTFFDRSIGIEPLMENARAFGVDDRILGVRSGVPETLLPCDYFDYAYTTTCLEMFRHTEGAAGYLAALKEIRRVLKKGGVLGLGEPMCLDMPIPEEVAPYCREYHYDKCYVTAEETRKAVAEAGFTILEYGYCEEADDWWRESAFYSGPGSDYAKAIELINNSGWLSFGYVIAIKE